MPELTKNLAPQARRRKTADEHNGLHRLDRSIVHAATSRPPDHIYRVLLGDIGRTCDCCRWEAASLDRCCLSEL